MKRSQVGCTRCASHAGSWYSADAAVLTRELRQWSDYACPPARIPGTKAIIAPHAGFAYSGQTAAYAYKMIDPTKIKRVFVLGPSHHFGTDKSMVTRMTSYATPFGDIPVDDVVREELLATKKFLIMDQEVDEAEHSLELHLPWIHQAMAGHAFTLVPVVVGSLSFDGEALYGKIFAKYLEDEANFFVISSDFCHWGDRFRYTYYDKRLGPIHKCIEWLDRTGMQEIQSVDPERFYEYLQRTQNTICGRHPIAVMLQALSKDTRKWEVDWLHYSQSTSATTVKDSSVSYAAGVIHLASK